MSKKNALPSHPRHILIFDEDWEFLVQEYGPQSKNKIGAGNAIRMLVHDRVQKMKARVNAQVDEAQAPKPNGGLEA